MRERERERAVYVCVWGGGGGGWVCAFDRETPGVCVCEGMGTL